MTILVLAVVLSGCGSDPIESGVGTTGVPATSSPAAPSAPVETPAIVGEWHRLQACAELEGAMASAGLMDALLESIAGDGWVPGVTSVDQIEDPSDPCRGAVSREHSHFFTSDGRFGSRNANGQQVDDGRYELLGDDAVVINDVTFHYEITGGDTIAFTPVVPDCAPSCFEAGWSVAVAYPGYTWQRVS